MFMDAISIGLFFGFFLAAFSALFIIMNPLSTATVFLTITKKDSMLKRRLIAKKACIASFIVLITFSLAGNLILSFFGITVDAFRIAGGLLIARVGFGMLSSKNENTKKIEEEKDAQKEAIEKDDVSLIPLAIPMLSGPGAMTTAIVLMGETGGWVGMNIYLIFSLILAIIAVCFASYIILRQSVKIEKHIGKNEHDAINKIIGLIVLVIGIQFLINGILGVISLI
jgi:multiple antibiotic resistance protein